MVLRSDYPSMLEFRDFPADLKPGVYGTRVLQGEIRDNREVIPIQYAPEIPANCCAFPVTIGV
jgi:hypothetical protein